MKYPSLIEVLKEKALTNAQQNIINFVTDKTNENWTYAVLLEHVQAVAAYLQANCPENAKILILLNPSLNYLSAYLGCLFAKCVAVPLFLPRNSREEHYLHHVLRDADSHTVLMDANCKMGFPDDVQLINIDSIPLTGASHYQDRNIAANDHAHIIYTSGTTSTPKGVLTSHKNITATLASLKNLTYREELLKGCGWLPPYHVSGLLACYLWPLYCNIDMQLFSPLHFARDPLFWLKTISEFRANVTLAPNFAYDLCVQLLKKYSTLALDLSCLLVAGTGGELVHAQTIKTFLAATKQYGIKKDIFYPAYGLTESTLFITGHCFTEGNHIIYAETSALQKQRVVTTDNLKSNYSSFVSCGSVITDHKLAIVDLTSQTNLPPYHIGEIWINGPCITEGYWQQPEITQQTYCAQLNNSTEKDNYFRTSDLGFLDDAGRLYITGRLKNMLVIRGKNYHAEDIEYSLENVHPQIGMLPKIAIGSSYDNEEYLAILQEVDGNSVNYTEIVSAIQKRIMHDYNLAVGEIYLLPLHSLELTATAKVKRKNYIELLQNKQLAYVLHWQSPKIFHKKSSSKARKNLSAQNKVPATEEEIQAWIITWISHELKLDPTTIDKTHSFVQIGLESLIAIRLLHEAELLFNIPLESNLAWEYPTIDAISQYIASQLKS